MGGRGERGGGKGDFPTKTWDLTGVTKKEENTWKRGCDVALPKEKQDEVAGKHHHTKREESNPPNKEERVQAIPRKKHCRCFHPPVACVLPCCLLILAAAAFLPLFFGNCCGTPSFLWGGAFSPPPFFRLVPFPCWWCCRSLLLVGGEVFSRGTVCFYLVGDRTEVILSRYLYWACRWKRRSTTKRRRETAAQAQRLGMMRAKHHHRTTSKKTKQQQYHSKQGEHGSPLGGFVFCGVVLPPSPSLG